MKKTEPGRESHITHTLAPVWDKESRILILGTMPSPKSREYGFYYMHPQNRFWPVLSAVYREKLPVTVEERRLFILRHNLALWDVLADCDIRGAEDSSIKNPVANDFSTMLSESEITRIYTTGKTAGKLYTTLCEPQTGISAVCLPSTSPANRGRWPLEKLIAAYRILL